MRATNTFGIPFMIRACRYTERLAGLYARVTVNGKRVEISLKKNIDPTTWDPATETLKGSNTGNKQVNRLIEDSRFRLRDCYQQLLNEKKLVSAAATKHLFLGESVQENTLCSLIAYHAEHMKNILEPGTMKNYYTTEKYIRRFLHHRYRADDILLTSLNYQFITEFEFFLRKTAPLDPANPLHNNGVMKHLERLRKMVTMAVKMEWLPRDPFVRYQLRFQRTEKEFLTREELDRLEIWEFSASKLNCARDLFVFSCYTGLAYVDLAQVTPANICLGIDGDQWLRATRKKTDTPFSVPLLQPALEILDRYRQDPSIRQSGRLLPQLCNQKINEYLKTIARECGINRHLNFHLFYRE